MLPESFWNFELWDFFFELTIWKPSGFGGRVAVIAAVICIVRVIVASLGESRICLVRSERI